MKHVILLMIFIAPFGVLESKTIGQEVGNGGIKEVLRWQKQTHQKRRGKNSFNCESVGILNQLFYRIRIEKLFSGAFVVLGSKISLDEKMKIEKVSKFWHEARAESRDNSSIVFEWNDIANNNRTGQIFLKSSKEAETQGYFEGKLMFENESELHNSIELICN